MVTSADSHTSSLTVRFLTIPIILSTSQRGVVTDLAHLRIIMGPTEDQRRLRRSSLGCRCRMTGNNPILLMRPMAPALQQTRVGRSRPILVVDEALRATSRITFPTAHVPTRSSHRPSRSVSQMRMSSPSSPTPPLPYEARVSMDQPSTATRARLLPKSCKLLLPAKTHKPHLVVARRIRTVASRLERITRQSCLLPFSTRLLANFQFHLPPQLLLQHRTLPKKCLFRPKTDI